jgi:adhesin transport system outer membrane protein
MTMSYPRFFLLASVCAAIAWAPAARAESLQKAVEAAVSEHPTVAAAQANRAALGEDVKEKRSDYFPQFSAELAGGRIYGDNATSRGLSVTRDAGYSGYGEGSVNLTQPLFDGFGTTNRVGAARARRDSAEYNIADVREDLALRTTLAYMDVLRAREALDRLQAYGKTIDSYISRIEKMVKEGGADATMREQARDVRAQLDNTVASSQGQLQTAIATYAELTGHVPDGSMDKPVPPLDIIPGTPQEAIAYARDHHPTLKAAALTEKAADLDSRAEKAAYYPALSGQLSYLESDEKDLLGGEVTDARALLKMNWNYALGGAEQAKVRKAVQQRAQSHAQQQAMERQIAKRIELAYSDNKTAEEQAKIQQQRVDLNDGLLKTQQQQFEGAKVNLLQLLQSDNSLFNARLALMSDEYKMLGAKYSILASMGRLQEVIKMAPVVAPAQLPAAPAAKPASAAMAPSSKKTPPPPETPLKPPAKTPAAAVSPAPAALSSKPYEK